MDLFTLTRPYATADKTEFDPNLGKHDAFLLLGPYIFAQVFQFKLLNPTVLSCASFPLPSPSPLTHPSDLS